MGESEMNKFWIYLIIFAGSYINAAAAQWPDYPVVYSTGMASKEIPPDLATITFFVTAFDEKSDNALSVVRDRNQEIIQYYRSQGLDGENIEAYDFTKNIIREDKDGTELKINGYEIRQQFSIKLPNLDHYTKLMEKLLTISNVSDIDTKFDIKQRKEIEASLISEACADAQLKAENMAHGLGATLESPEVISESGFHGLDDALGLSRLGVTDVLFKKTQYSNETAPEITFIPSRIKIQKGVNVIYRISKE